MLEHTMSVIWWHLCCANFEKLWIIQFNIFVAAKTSLLSRGRSCWNCAGSTLTTRSPPRSGPFSRTPSPETSRTSQTWPWTCNHSVQKQIKTLCQRRHLFSQIFKIWLILWQMVLLLLMSSQHLCQFFERE